VAQSAVSNAAAENYVDASDTASQPTTASTLLLDDLAVDDGSVGHFPY